jgi:putative DNA primase/helicase
LVCLCAQPRQSEAARQIAEKLGIPLYKNDPAAVGAKSNGSSPAVPKLANRNGIDATPQASSQERAPDIFSWGEEGPPRQDAEIRRHYYPSDRCPRQKVKIKLGSKPKDTWVTWYRVFKNGVPIGWQAKKPDDYTAIPYVTTALDPFDAELKADALLWPEGEKDVETLSQLNLPAFTFGGVGDGLPDGIGHHLRNRRLVILADNDEPGREHAEKKACAACEPALVPFASSTSWSCRRRAMFPTSLQTAALLSNYRPALKLQRGRQGFQKACRGAKLPIGRPAAK